MIYHTLTESSGSVFYVSKDELGLTKIKRNQ